MSEADIVIVGAGASGLAAAAVLQREGRRPVLLEHDDRVGGTWERRYDRLCLHTTRRFSGLPFYPLPSSYPAYVPAKLYASYLRDYVERLGLDVRCGEVVEEIRTGDSGGLIVATSERVWQARAVIVATGRHNRKRAPAWPGSEQFRGTILHAADYRSGRPFRDSRALVIGLGNSGAEIAVDLLEHGAASVSVAVRTPPPISPREIAGIPIQLLGMLLAPCPPRLADWAGSLTRRVGNGNLGRYGLQPASWGPFTTKRPPVIDTGFVKQLKAGRIRILPEVAGFTDDGVEFEGNRCESFDVVVAATGFTTGLEGLVSVDHSIDQHGFPRCDVAARHGLFFTGFVESPRGQLFESSRGARKLARDVSRFLEK